MEAGDFDAMTERLGRQGGILERQMAKICQTRWQDFKIGLHQVQEMEEELAGARFVCAIGRDELRQAAEQLREGNVAAHFRHKQVLQQEAQILSAVLEALKCEERAIEALNNREPDYARARSLCSQALANPCLGAREFS